MQIASLALFMVMASCKGSQNPDDDDVSLEKEAWLLRVGSEVITEGDLELYLKERYDGRSDKVTRKLALDELAQRARYVAAALDAGLASDAVVKAEISRIFKNRYREESLFPEVKKLLGDPVPVEELRRIYEDNKARYESNEKRQVAVLWLSPGADPKRRALYEKKLKGARSWLIENEELMSEPEKGFGVLSVDHSEHAASRFKSGILGWVEKEGGIDKWDQAISEIAFSLDAPGDVSEVLVRSEGIFLVRYMNQKTAVVRSFETVKGDLARALKNKQREELEAKFKGDLIEKYPLEWSDGN